MYCLWSLCEGLPNEGIRDIMNKTDFYKKLTLLSLPIALQSFLVSSLSFADTIMVGKLGEVPLAAVGVANQIYIFINFIFFGISSGVGAFLAQYYGREEWEKVRRVTSYGCVLSLAVSIVFGLFTFLCPRLVMNIFSKDPLVVDEGIKYLRIVAFSYIGPALTLTISTAFRTQKRAQIPLLVTLFSGSLNVFLNWIFIYGNLGSTSYGASGAAMATFISRITEILILLLITYLTRKNGKIYYHFAFFLSDMHYSLSFTKNFFKISLPIIMNETFWGLGNILYKVAFSLLGTSALAAMNITESITNFFVIAMMAISNASLVLLGETLGKGNKTEAKNESRYVVRASAVMGTFLALLEICAAPLFASLFNVSLEVQNSAINAMRVYALAIPFRTVAVGIIVGVLRSGGDTTAAFLLESATLYFVGLPIAFILSGVFHFDISIVYFAILAEALVKMLLCFYRMHTGKWLKIIN